MLKKVLIKGPVLSRSGYGEQARFALRALQSRPDLFDIYIVNIPWGRTGQISAVDEEANLIHEILMKTQAYVQQKGQFDISLQVTIPNEFEKIAPVNIGYTAGIETTKVSPQWIAKSNETVDKIIVVSNHSKKVFEQTKYDVKDQAGNEHKGWGLQVPVEAVNYPVRMFEPEELNIEFRTNKNFLTVAQWGPRKNLENTIKWFVEAFADDEDVGLVVKTSTASDSAMDRELTQKRLEALLSACGPRKCSVYLIHGEVSPGNLAWLYEHPTMKAMINIGHGEGYGLPLFEAAYHGLPLITTTWSGQMDFICKPNKKGKQVPRVIKVDYDIKEVQKHAVWNGVIQADSKWAYAKEKYYKSALKDSLEKETHWRNEAETLKNHIHKNFSSEIIYSNFVEEVLGRKANIEPEEVRGISFCIPTNAKRKEKFITTVSSIKQEMGDFPYEIVVAGDVESLKDLDGLIFVDMKDEARSGRVAALRNAAGQISKYDTIVWCDDDMILSDGWLAATLEYSANNGWSVLGNKIYNPDGTRHWDRATLSPHKLVDYDHPTYDKKLYQTSGFFMVRRQVFEMVKWNNDRVIHADQSGGVSEDVQYSIDLIRSGLQLSFNENAMVWHNDKNYTEINNLTLSLKDVEKHFGQPLVPYVDERFENISNAYGVKTVENVL